MTVINASRNPAWVVWDGEGLPSDGEVVYFSFGHVDITRPAQSRALALALHRDGVSDSLGEAFKLLEKAHILRGRATYVGEDRYLTYYEPDNEYEDSVDPALATWVEIDLGDY